jgi:NADH-ubiquinone oxidoreductase chain 6
LSGVLILTSKNPVVSVLFLISLFGSISVYLIILGLSFVGLSYLIVYIGAVSILFLFILMLINIRISELQNNTANSIPLAVLIIISLSYTTFQILPYDIAVLNNSSFINTKLYNSLSFGDKIINNNDLSFVTSNSWDTSLMEVNHISSIGNVLYTSHNIWLIITSFILLLAMVGAIVITIKNNDS